MFDRAKNISKARPAAKPQKRSLDELFKLQHGPLVRFVNSRIKDHAEAEEIVQEAFIRFQKKYVENEPAAPEALLVRICSNLVIDKVREKNARAAREDTWGKLHTAGADNALSTTESVDPARALDAKQQVEAVMEILGKLPEKTRQIFMLHRFEGLSHAEVSAQTGIPKSTIEKHMIRAIKALAHLRGG